MEIEAHFRALVEAAPFFLFRTDASGRATYLNSAFGEYSEQGPRVSVASHWLDAVHLDDRYRVSDLWAEATRTSQTFHAKARLTQRDGAERWFLIRAAPLRQSDGQVHGWFGGCIDIHDIIAVSDDLARDRELLSQMVETRTADLMRAASERERAQEALMQGEKLQAIGQLTGGVAHDFNNTLQIIASGLALLKMPTLTPDRQKFLMDGMDQAVRNAANLTARLLTFARQQTLNPRTLDLSAIIKGVVELLKHSIGASVEIITDIDVESIFVHVDPTQLETALLNLSVNARDAMPQGGRLLISLRRNVRDFGEGRLDVACLTLADTGEGMTPQVKSRVFEPFFTTKPVGRGTGLGLAQVYGFVKQSAGDIEIDSEIGKGTRVTIFLPTKSEPQPDGQLQMMTATSDLRGKTILIVDDNEQVAQFVESMLGELGCQTLTVGNAEQALSILQTNNGIDGVFSDVMMPGAMDGIDLYIAVRQLYPHIGVVLATGYNDKLFRDGMPEDIEILSKPFRLNEASAALVRALAVHRVK